MNSHCSLPTALAITLILCLCTGFVHAQPTSSRGWYEREDIQHVDIGWMKVLSFKEPARPFAQHGWSYTAKQTGYTQKFATWLYQTYTPKGMLGEMKLSVLAPEPSYPETSKYYSSNEAEKNNQRALPNTYGAYGKMYMLLMKTAQQKFWPINGMANYWTWYIMANNVALISNQVVSLSSPEEYYFIMPRYNIGMKGNFEREWNEQGANYRNFTNSANLQRYEHYMVPSKVIDPGTEKYVVVITKDRKPLPFEQLTMRDFISRVEDQFPMMHKIAINNGVRVDNLLENAKRGFQLLKEKYKNQLNEYVYVTDLNHHISLQSFAQIEPGKNIYWLRTLATPQEDKDNMSTSFPILRIKKGVKEACATGEPQWIVCRIEKGSSPANEGEIHMMENFVERFNYDYLYNYFFGPDKVIQPYKPLPFGDNKTTTAATPLAQSAEAKKKAGDPSILFFDDFSTVPTGTDPSNWTTQRSEISGEKVSVVTLEGTNGKWLRLKKTATPKTFPSLSGDLEMSYDLLVQKGDVPWGTPGMEAQLLFSSTQGDRKYTMDVSPGNMNRIDAQGWVMLNLNTPGCKLSNYYSLPDFTGSKPINKVTMTFRKKGESLTILCNNNKVYECNTAFAAGMSLKGLQFYVNEKNVYYISNVIIKKL